MAKLEELIIKLKNLPAFLQAQGNAAIEENAIDIVDLNKAQMLVLGIDSEENPLGLYAPKTKKIRQAKGLQTDYIDLRFTGDFQNSMEILPDGNNKYELIASDGKWNGNEISPTLSQRYPNALGLIKDNETKVTEMLSKFLDKAIDNYFQISTQPKVYSNAINT